MLKLNDGRIEIWQWDTGRKLTVDAECSQVHFSNKVFGRSIDVDVVDGVASIPDILLQTDKELTTWAFVGTPENGYTKISKTFKVNRRNKPADYVFTPPEQTTLSDLVERLDKIEESQDPDAIKNAVDDYLQNNPIQIDEKDPTVPNWAKQPEKPKYTATEVGALPSTAKIPSKTSELNNDSGFVNNAVANLINYYLKSETYSRDEVKQLISAIPKFSIKPVSQLPTTGISETTIYLVPGGDGDDLYTEYIRVSGDWEILGSQKMDLTGYATEIYVKDYAQPKGNYLTEVPKGYATEQFVQEKIAEAELGGEEVDLSGYALKSELPKKTSQLENDSGYLNAIPEGYAKTEDIPTKPEDIGAQPAGDYAIDSEIRLELEAINRRLTAFFDSDDQTLDELSEIVAYITSNKSLIDSITTSKVSVADIINNLTTNVTNKPLSAAQGVVLKGLIDTLSGNLENYQPKGDYALRAEIPAVPVKSVNGKTGAVNLTAADVKARPDTWIPSAADVGALPSTTVIPTVPTKLSAFTNDSGFITGYTETDPTVPAWAKQASKPSYSKSEVGLGNVDNVKQYSASNPPPYPVTSVNGMRGDVTLPPETVLYIAQSLTEAQKAQARANIGATAGEDVEYAESLDWLSQNGDTTKKYVLPDGYIYTYTQKTVEVKHNANDETCKLNARPTPNTNKDSTTADDGCFTTAPIQIDKSWNSYTVNLSGLDALVEVFYNACYVYYYAADGSWLGYTGGQDVGMVKTGTSYVLPQSMDLSMSRYWASAAYIRIMVGIKSGSVTASDVASFVINVEGLDTYETLYGWYSTGIQHSNDQATQQNSADIAALKEEVAALKETVQTPSSQSGAVWYAVGDSITKGYGVTADTCWVAHVRKYNGYDAEKSKNLGISGLGFAKTDPNYGKTARTVVDENDFSAVDLVTVAIGINDWKEPYSIDTVKSEMGYCFEKILTDNPYCKIIFIAPFNIWMKGSASTNWALGYSGSDVSDAGTLQSFIDAQKSVCREYGIQVIDMTWDGIINPQNIETVLYDKVHPNAACHLALGRELARRIAFA